MDSFQVQIVVQCRSFDDEICFLIGGYDKEEKAARAYDLAALKYWGSTATTNFPVISYSSHMFTCHFCYICN